MAVIIRDVLLDALRPHIPRGRKGWALIETQRTVDKIARTTVVLRQERIERDPAAPAVARRAFFTLLVASPLEDPGAAEHAMDDAIVDLLNALDGIGNLTWTTCTKGVWADEYPAPTYAIEIWTTYTKEQDNG
jgi:hypothetical protein